MEEKETIKKIIFFHRLFYFNFYNLNFGVDFVFSRSQSPVMASEAALYRFHALSPQVRSANIYQRTPNSCNTSAFANESFLEGPSAPQPEVCLEHLWTEPAPPIRCVCVLYILD